MKPKSKDIQKRFAFLGLVAICTVVMYFAIPYFQAWYAMGPPPRVERHPLDINRFWQLSTQPSGDVPVVSVAAGGRYSLVILEDGSLCKWRSMYSGYMSDAMPENYLEPIWIMDDVVAVEVGRHWWGGDAIKAITSCGTLWNIGQDLRWNFNNTPPTPVRVMDNVIAVSIDGGTVMVITSDNVLWGWGRNRSGQLGNGTTDDVIGRWSDGRNPDFPHPVRIMEDVIYVSVGDNHTMAITSDNICQGGN